MTLGKMAPRGVVVVLVSHLPVTGGLFTSSQSPKVGVGRSMGTMRRGTIGLQSPQWCTDPFLRSVFDSFHGLGPVGGTTSA